jgi:hypothetical protein
VRIREGVQKENGGNCTIAEFPITNEVLPNHVPELCPNQVISCDMEPGSTHFF